jgi:hypothetical protein
MLFSRGNPPEGAMLFIAGGVILGLIGFGMIISIFAMIFDLIAWIGRHWRISLLVVVMVGGMWFVPWITSPAMWSR